MENGSVNTKITSTGKESFFNNEDLENEKLANLMASLYDGANDESLRSDALTVETHENDRSMVDCCKENKNICTGTPAYSADTGVKGVWHQLK